MTLLAYALATIFAVAGAAKIVHRTTPDPLFSVLRIPPNIASAAWLALPFVEIVAACLLLAPVFRWLGAAVALLLGTLFSLTIAGAIVLGKQYSCACFGRPSTHPVSLITLLRNIIITDLALVVLIWYLNSTGRLEVNWLALLVSLALFSVIAVLLTNLLAKRFRGSDQSRGNSALPYEFNPFELLGKQLPDVISAQLWTRVYGRSPEHSVFGSLDNFPTLSLKIDPDALLVFSQEGCYECNRLKGRFGTSSHLANERIYKFNIEASSSGSLRRNAKQPPIESTPERDEIEMDGYSMSIYPSGLLVSSDGMVVDIAVGADAIEELASQLEVKVGQ
jgi:hypothetical protein